MDNAVKFIFSGTLTVHADVRWLSDPLRGQGLPKIEK